MDNVEDNASYPPNPKHNNLADVVGDGKNNLADLVDNGDNNLADVVDNGVTNLADDVDYAKNNLADVDNGDNNVADDVNNGGNNLADVVDNAENNLADDVDDGDNSLADNVDSGENILADVDNGDENLADDVDNGDENLADDVDNGDENLADDVENGDTNLADDIDNGDENLADDVDNGDENLADDIDNGGNNLADGDNEDSNVADDVDNGGDDYDTEDTEDDDNKLVEEIRSNGQMKGIVISGDIDDTDDDIPNGYNTRRIQDAAFEREEEKKRKLQSLLSNYEFAPRRTSHGGRNSLTDWTEQESFVLLDAWGERFLKHNRKSVRSEEWQEVAEKVSEGPKIKRTETQCRNRLDTLKKQYKKEKAKLAENIAYSSKWVYFKKMDMYLSPSSNQANGYASETSKALMLHGNGVKDEMRDSLVKEESDNLSDLPPPKRIKRGRVGSNGDACKLIAKSIHRFGNAYEEIESSTSKHLIELKNFRMDIQRDLELQRQKLLEKTSVEIAKIWGLDNEDNDLSPSNGSG